MLDKIYYKSDSEVILYYTCRPPVTLHHDGGRVIELLDEFLAPLSSQCITFSEYRRALKNSLEDTVVIYLDEVA